MEADIDNTIFNTIPINSKTMLKLKMSYINTIASTHGIANHEIDMYDFHTHTFIFCEATFKTYLVYVDSQTFDVVVFRANDTDELKAKIKDKIIYVMILKTDPISGKLTSSIVTMGYCEDVMCVRIQINYNIYPGKLNALFIYRQVLPVIRSFNKLTRNEFNAKFDAGLVVLPTSMYAIGFVNGIWFMYNETYDQYYNISHVCQFILRVCEQYIPDIKTLYFVISSCDGYGENLYCNIRNKPYLVGETECTGIRNFTGFADNQYPVYHKRKYIVCQSSHVNMPYVINIPDRHYLYHNLYNSFRSFHRGTIFEKKIPKLVFAGQLVSRGNQYNFIHSHHIEMNPRDYFVHCIAPNHDFIECDGRWIHRETQIDYKYILDIDGNASTYDATAWKLNSNSVIFKPRSVWTQWFYDEYNTPGKYFIELKDDFSDIAEKFEWCETHPVECGIMIRNCRALFQRIYSIDAVINRVIDVIHTINYA